MMNPQNTGQKTFFLPGSGRIRAKTLPLFSRSLGAMLDAGMTLTSSLRSLESQEPNPHFKALILWMRLDVDKGIPLSNSIPQFPTVFDAVYLGMIKAAETTGRLPETLKELALLTEAREKVKRKVRMALVYPSIVLGIAVIVISFIVAFVLPAFTSFYESFGAELPGPTKFLLRLSSFAKHRGMLALAAIVALGIGAGMFKKTPGGRRMFDQIVLALPIFGDLARKLAGARFARAYGALIRSGVPALSALDVSALSTGNTIVSEAILNARASVEQGNPLSLGLAGAQVLPPTLLAMLKTGEQTGRIDEMLASIAEFYEEEVNTALAGITAMLQPLLIVIIGVVIGGLAISALLPLFRAPELIH